jgi:tetratricopeptide (TPR) repeat protein
MLHKSLLQHNHSKTLFFRTHIEQTSLKPVHANSKLERVRQHIPSSFLIVLPFGLLMGILMPLPWAFGQQQQPPEWETQVRKYAEVRDWTDALNVVDTQFALAPQNMDIRAWRARVLAWSGDLTRAEKEYLAIVEVVPNDPDNWMDLGNIYIREGRTDEALRALDRAVELDPKRADLREAHARGLRAAGELKKAGLEFQAALNLNPSSPDARVGLASLRGDPKHELRFSEENDVFNFASTNHDGGVSLVSNWTPHWTTSVSGDFFEIFGANAGKFVGSVTGRLPGWGALTIGGATAHDNTVIPRAEAFFDLDHGWKIGETGLLRGMEIVYGQHWYWYATARILAVNGSSILYFPNDWSWSLRITGARSFFSGAGTQWQPTGISRLAFPLAHFQGRQLSGNVLFAVGTEDFAQVYQIGSFSSHTFGGGLRFQFAKYQDIAGSVAYQQRTQSRTDTTFGFSYGIHF